MQGWGLPVSNIPHVHGEARFNRFAVAAACTHPLDLTKVYAHDLHKHMAVLKSLSSQPSPDDSPGSRPQALHVLRAASHRRKNRL